MGWWVGLVVIGGIWLVAPGGTRWLAATLLVGYIAVWALAAYTSRGRR